jgi:hypothetical protein
MRADGPPPTRAVSQRRPFGIPDRSAMKRPFGRTANCEVTSRPPSRTTASDALFPFGRSIATSALPADVRSARPDRTLIFGAAAACASPAMHTASTKPSTAPLTSPSLTRD